MTRKNDLLFALSCGCLAVACYLAFWYEPKGGLEERGDHIEPSSALALSKTGATGVFDVENRGDHEKPSTKDVNARDRLWSAICKVESNNNPDAVGDGGKAVGVAQIWPIMVEDVNRIVGYDKFTREDRRSPERSRMIFDVFVGYYGKDKSDQWVARAWNGGPGWESKPTEVNVRTASYWLKVKEAMR